MARKLQKLINYHTSGLTSMPASSDVQYGEIVVRHNETKPELLIKVGKDKFATFVDKNAVETQVKNSVDALSASVNSNFATKASLESASGNIETTITSLKTALEGADSAIATELSAVSKTVTELSAGTVAEVTRLDGRVDSAFTSAVTVSKEYTNVQLSAVTEDLQGQIDDADSAITAVKTSVSELSAGTVAEVTRLDTAITTAKNDAIEAASAFTLGEIQKVNNVNDGLAKRVETLESSASTLSAELAELSGVTEDFSAATHTALTGLSAGTRAEVTRLDGRVDSAFTSAVTVASGYTDKRFSEDFAPIKEKVNTLIGEDSGKTARSIAAEEVAKIVDGADEAFDTLKEIAEWIGKGSGTTAAQIITDIEGLKSADTVISGAVNAVSATVVANKDDIAALGAASAAVKTSVSELSGATEAEVARLDGRIDSAFTSATTYVDAQISAVTKSLTDKEEALDKRVESLEALSATTQSAIQSATFAEGDAAKSGVKIEKSGTTLVFDFSELIIDCGEF